MDLILNPKSMPRHWAMSKRGSWLIKRAYRKMDEHFVYTVERHVKDKAEPEAVFVIKENFLLNFLKRFRAIAMKKGSNSPLNLFKEYDGKLINILQETGTSDKDVSTYDEAVKRRPGQKVSDEEKKQIVEMFYELEGSKEWRFKRIGLKMNLSYQTVRRHFNEARPAKAA